MSTLATITDLTYLQNVSLVDVDQLTYDRRVQRSEGIDEKRAAAMAAAWDPAAVNVINISRRKDGSLVIIDGAHRWAGARIRGLKTLLAIIHDGLTVPQEAAMFLLLNKFKSPSAVSLFLARVVKGDSDACEIDALITSHGWRIQQNADPGCIFAVAALQDIYNTGAGVLNPGSHADLLDWVLDVTTAAWEHDSTSANAAILKGLAQLKGRYGSAVQGKKLVHGLQQTRPSVLLGRGKQLREAQGGTLPAAMGKVFVGLHNKGLRTNLLPEWVWTR